ncbi:MAG: tetratricopeptide repeat protein [Planctomycetes bacterium]|nr:tetratricopeptide repeat protein [Planctomycetota bacterium]
MISNEGSSPSKPPPQEDSLANQKSDSAMKPGQNISDDKAQGNLFMTRGGKTVNRMLGALKDEEQDSSFFEETSEFKEGEEFADKFRIVQKLGSGGMGSVYKAYEPALKRHVAIKILDKTTNDAFKRFQLEAETIAKLGHPSIVSIYDIGTYNGRPYLSMQYIDGEALDTLIGKLTITECLDITAKACEALEHAHNHGVIHRDIKPQNILIDKEKNVYIADFGIARHMDSDLTMTGSMTGTPAYMSPEQAKGLETNARSDVYSVGATLYHCLTSKPPFEGKNIVDIAAKIADKTPISIRKINSKIHKDIETIVNKCLYKEPNVRYQRATDLQADIRRFLNGEGILARDHSITYIILKKVKKYRLLLSVVLLIVVPSFYIAASEYIDHQNLVKADIVLEKGISLYWENKLNEAMDSFKHAISIKHDFSKALYYMGMVYRDMKRVEDALSKYKEVIKLEKDYVIESLVTISTIYLEQKRFQDGINEAFKVIELHPNNHEAYHNISAGFFGMGMLDEAFQYGQKTIDLKPDYAEGYDMLGGFWAKKGDLDKAIQNCMKAIELKPTFGLAYANIGLLYSRKGDNEKAKEYSKKAVEIYPSSSITHNTLGYIYSQLDDYPKARKSFEKAVSLEPDNVVNVFNLATAYTRLQRYEEAIEHFTKATELDQNHLDAWYYRGTAQHHLQRYQDSIKSFENIVSRKQDYRDTLFKLGYSYAMMGDTQNAISYYLKSIEITPNIMMAHYNLANIYVHQGEFEDAVKLLQTVIKTDPGYGEAYITLSVAYRGLSNTDKSKSTLVKIIELKPDFTPAYNELGLIYAGEGKYDDAIELLKKGIAAGATHPSIYYNLGRSYIAIGDKKLAVQQYEILKSSDVPMAQDLQSKIDATFTAH